MNVTQFWELIDKSGSWRDARLQSDLLAKELARWPMSDMFEFEDVFSDLKNQSYRADLWAAAFVIECGCSNDGFAEFREWLVGRGQVASEKALADPESLIEVIEVGSGNIYPTLLGVVADAYEQATGQKAPPRFWDSAPLIGEHLDETAALARFPRLKVKYWNMWIEQFNGQ